MAANPTYAGTPNVNLGQLSAANTARDGSGTLGTTLIQCWTAGTKGAVINRVIIKAEGNPADCVITLFLYNGTNTRLFDEFDIGDPAAASTTVAGYREERYYNDMPIPPNWQVRAAITVVPTAGLVDVWVVGEDI